MSQQEVLVYGAEWCRDCLRAKNFLQKRGILYKWIDVVDNPEAERFVVDVNHGLRVIPTILLPDGRILIEPSYATLESAFGRGEEQ